MDQIKMLAEPLAGKRVLHLSATAFGGGVAEILYTLVPLMRDAGLETEWRVIYGQEEFFDVTKAIHNGLQGAPRSLGLLPGGSGVVALKGKVLAGADTLAVTVEPAGGSPTGAPTGPIVYAGKFTL